MEKQRSPYWFKRRRYGYGWIPVTWQGWLTLILFIVVVVLAAFQLPPKPNKPTAGQMVQFFATLLVALIVFMIIAYTKGPVPRWRWGKKDTDNPDEDF